MTEQNKNNSARKTNQHAKLYILYKICAKNKLSRSFRNQQRELQAMKFKRKEK